MTKIWIGEFWGEPRDPGGGAPAAGRGWRLLPLAPWLAVIGTLAVAVFAGPIWNLSEAAAIELLDPTTYVEAVRG